jgi:hypothetical protein
MAYEASGSRSLDVVAPLGAASAERAAPSPSLAFRVFLLTRTAIAALAVVAALALGTGSARVLPGAPPNSERFDAPGLTQPFDDVGDALFAPLARWDAVWYLSIADSGYESRGADSPGARAAFFPLYPLLVRALALPAGASPEALLLAAYAVSLAAFLGALYLLHRLVALELGARIARATLLLLALFPAAYYFGAPYAESLFLLVSVAAFYAARTGHWAWASVAAAAASATRSVGIVLLVPLAILYLYGPRGDGSQERDRPRAAGLGRLRPRYRLRADALWLALAPVGLAAYATYLGVAHGDAFAFLRLQEAWHREFAGPFGAVWNGAVAAFEGVRQLASGSRTPVFFEQSGGDPFQVARDNLMLFGFLVFAAVASVGALRRLPAAYGSYAVVALALPLSFPVGPQPLMSLPRFLSVLFPLFVWLALVCEERRVTGRTLAVSALLLGLLTAQFATWHWVA